jgi:hypothetical protein
MLKYWDNDEMGAFSWTTESIPITEYPAPVNSREMYRPKNPAAPVTMQEC